MSDGALAKEVIGALLEAQQALRIAYLTCSSVDVGTFESALGRVDGVITQIGAGGGGAGRIDKENQDG